VRNLQVDGERLWASLMELAQIGATPKGGVCRLAASDLDGEARRLFIGWCNAGMRRYSRSLFAIIAPIG
jgi:beta-ureidopropionase / N-carbamoyl-L-amino-acid hydrolase